MSQLAVKEVQGELSREKIELIKQTVAKGATDLELELFFHACKRTGLDPLMKQIYAIKRWNSQERRETLAFQTGIDGYRLIAERTGCYAGSSDAEYEEGMSVGAPPILARVTVTKLVNGTPCQFTASARWNEYVQKNKEGQPTSMWQKMPYLMLAKCAESLALRKAFPAELSGLYTHEEMQQADEEPAKPVLSPVQRYQQNKARIATAFQEIREDIKQVVEQDGAEPKGVSQHIAEASGSHLQSSDAAPPFLLDDINETTWGEFLEYVADDPERTKVGKAVKKRLAYSEMSKVPAKARRGIMLTIQDEARRQGVPFSEWVKE